MPSDVSSSVGTSKLYTGRFVVSELRRRGVTAILAARDRAKLELLHRLHPSFEIRVASVDDDASLDRGLI